MRIAFFDVLMLKVIHVYIWFFEQFTPRAIRIGSILNHLLPSYSTFSPKALVTLHEVTAKSFCLLPQIAGFSNNAAAGLGAPLLQVMVTLHVFTMRTTLVDLIQLEILDNTKFS